MKRDEPKLSDVLDVMNAAFSRIEAQMATKQDIADLRSEMRGEMRTMEHRMRDHFDAKFADTNALVRGHEIRIQRLESFHSR